MRSSPPPQDRTGQRYPIIAPSVELGWGCWFGCFPGRSLKDCWEETQQKLEAGGEITSLTRRRGNIKRGRFAASSGPSGYNFGHPRKQYRQLIKQQVQ